LADRYSVAPDIFEKTMATVAMPNPHTREELISCLIVANEHDLNPLTKEIHFMRSKTGQIQPIVGVDGWVKKLNTHPQFDGLKFDYEWSGAAPGKKLFSVTCTIYRKDRKYPIEVTEFMSECIRLPAQGKGPNAWVLNPTRMLRHRALIQGTRYAIGFGGVMDMDEFERWQEMKDITPQSQQAALAVPDDIADEATVAPTVTEAEDNQDALLANPQKHVEELEASLRMAKTEEEFNEIWAAHEELVEAGRLPRAYAEEAETIKEKLGKRFA
jgi:phage recombination protein Bet